jgi:signal transduction histidine kinase
VHIEVRDDGPGLSDEQQRRLFRDFERLDADRSSIPGAGIGLALSLRLVQLMHGTIGVRSQAGQGCAFWVRLPAAAAAAPS